MVRLAASALVVGFSWILWSLHVLSVQIADIDATLVHRDACVEAVHVERSASAERCEMRAADAALRLHRCEDALEALK